MKQSTFYARLDFWLFLCCSTLFPDHWNDGFHFGGFSAIHQLCEPVGTDPGQRGTVLFHNGKSRMAQPGDLCSIISDDAELFRNLKPHFRCDGETAQRRDIVGHAAVHVPDHVPVIPYHASVIGVTHKVPGSLDGGHLTAVVTQNPFQDRMTGGEAGA